MGGFGSGARWGLCTHAVTEDFLALDVRRWHRKGLLVPFSSFAWNWHCHGEVVASIRVRVESDQVILDYRHRSSGGDWKDECYPVRLEWTPCNFGGERPWFICPAMGCGRRVAILYGGGLFVCRHCRELVYASQRETIQNRAARRANKIRAKLGWDGGLLCGEGAKPKGMHWSHYGKLAAVHRACVESWAISILGWVGKVKRRFNLKF
jgi:hypothetical protein